jgi:Ca2+-binding EF-hand superfamily protein
MGNYFQSFSLPKENSSNNNNTPAWTLVAVSHALRITPLQLLELRQHCRVGSLGQKRTCPKISKTAFSKAMARSQMVQRRTVGILGHLFSMWDEDGTERVDYINFLTGISVLASCQDCESVEDVVLFALQVQDVHKTHCITRAKLESLRNGINVTVAYLGDAVLSTNQVQTIAHEVFESSQQLHHHVMSHDECARRVQYHFLVKDFLQGKGHYKYNVMKHSLQPQEEEEEESDLIVRLSPHDDTHDGVPSTEIGASTYWDKHNEI